MEINDKLVGNNVTGILKEAVIVMSKLNPGEFLNVNFQNVSRLHAFEEKFVGIYNNMGENQDYIALADDNQLTYTIKREKIQDGQRVQT